MEKARDVVELDHLSESENRETAVEHFNDD